MMIFDVKGHVFNRIHKDDYWDQIIETNKSTVWVCEICSTLILTNLCKEIKEINICWPPNFLSCKEVMIKEIVE